MIFIVLVIKSLLTPLDNSTVQSLFDGLRIVDKISITFRGATDEELSMVTINRIRLNGDEEPIWLEKGKDATYNDSLHYIRDIRFLIPASLVRDGVVHIGKKVYRLAEHHDDSSAKIENELLYFTLTDTNFPSTTSAMPGFSSIINFKGDLFFFSANLLLALLYYCILFIFRKWDIYWFDLFSLTIVVLSILMFKMLIAHYNLVSLFIVFVDLAIFLGAYSICLVSCGNSQKSTLTTEKSYFWVLLIIVVIFLFQNQFYFFHRESTLDEGKYLIRGYWYVKGLLQPYSRFDGNSYPPVYFFVIGLWQTLIERFLPLNLLTIRLLPLLLIFFNTALIVVIIKKITKSLLWTIVALFLYTLAPFAGVLYNYSHPIVYVNTLLLLAFCGYLYMEKLPAWGNILLYSSLYVVLFFTRRNMVLILPWVFLFQVAFSKTRVVIALGTVIMSSLGVAAVFLLFPIKLLYNYAGLPVIGKILFKLDILKVEDIPGGRGTTRGVTPTWEYSKDPFWMIWRHKLWSYSNRYFLIFSMLNTFSIWLANTNNSVKKYALASGTIFLASALLHAVGSPYPANVFSYVHYAFSLGIIGATLGLKLMIELFETEKSRQRLFALILISHVLFFFSRSVYRYYVAPEKAHHLQSIVRLSNTLEKYSLQDEDILIIDSYRYIAQMAVHYAGGKPEPATLNLPFAHAQPRDPDVPVPEEKYRERNRWSDEMMQRWIEDEKQLVVLYNDDKYAPVWKPVIEQHFGNRELFYFPYIGWYTIYSR